MGDSKSVEFIRKRNADWTIHSYCTRCFATVADEDAAEKVTAAEEEHECDPRLLEMVEKYRKVSRLVSAA
jgi:hypothetical protein